MGDELLGKKLVDLPPPHTKAVTAKASDAEQILYDTIEERLDELRSEKLDDDDPRKELSNKLAQVTCLRQLVTLYRVVISVADDLRLTANPDLIEDEILVRLFSCVLSKLTDKLQLMFDVEHLQALQAKLRKLEGIEKTRVLLDMMQDRE
jgi:hypothetical protein